MLSLLRMHLLFSAINNHVDSLKARI